VVQEEKCQGGRKPVIRDDDDDDDDDQTVELTLRFLYPRGKNPRSNWIGNWVRPQSRS